MCGYSREVVEVFSIKKKKNVRKASNSVQGDISAKCLWQPIRTTKQWGSLADGTLAQHEVEQQV